MFNHYTLGMHLLLWGTVTLAGLATVALAIGSYLERKRKK